jgi:nitrogen regulatory protein PII
MLWVIAIVRPFQAQEILAALTQYDVEGIEVTEARGYGRQKGLLERYQEAEFSRLYLPKIQIRFLVRKDLFPQICQRIETIARTGRIGDGKIMALEVCGCIDL